MLACSDSDTQSSCSVSTSGTLNKSVSRVIALLGDSGSTCQTDHHHKEHLKEENGGEMVSVLLLLRSVFAYIVLSA